MWSNNDLMDPDWKPEPTPDAGIIKSVKEIYYKLASLNYRFDKWSDEQLDEFKKDGKHLSCAFSIDEVKEIRQIIKKYR